MKELFSEKLSFRISGRLWVESEHDRFLGPGRVELMEKIMEFGSIAKAAAAMQMSYKKAWDLVTSMNTQAKQPFVLTQTGGKKGGGAIVTEEGKQAIQAYQNLQQRNLKPA
ncbi:winged helix-turn-helix domain-containing protein [Adhaeribacter radiodurans]|uniref:LysR family transcriptional regulator n=1 Tax=Adhaeribacter radiodurans TaxID=2745197 RepID=A0A7L7L5Y2_9BACT|nr:LysR family transcriptional regulator [Adhaeribacter radiodurans]QMU28231.1 LysR family transcriptional regulator [Adhaeribacter radiodurans]